MRTAFLIGAEYEWAHHVEYARAAGFTNEEIARIASGADAAGWSEEHGRYCRPPTNCAARPSSPIAPGSVLAKHYNHQTACRDRLHGGRLHDDRSRHQ